MEANDFVARLKASGNEKDLCDLEKVISEHKVILSKLAAKDRGSFCLNVLCILCRNIDKVPSWRDSVDPKLLLTLSIDCVRETRTMEKPDRVKTLACVYHIHRFMVRLKSSIPPELVLKISFMPFECDVKNMLVEYAKTYWSILVDRLTYIEVLKAGKVAVVKLLPKLTEDMLKVIQIYDTVQFCTNALTFLIKKLHSLYNDRHSSELNKVYGQIFNTLTTKSDTKNFKELTDNALTDLYVKFNDIFYVIVENSTKNNFKDSILNDVVRTCISFLGHRSDIFHCFQTFYSNAFCNIFSSMKNSNYNETIFNSLLLSFETTEKLGYSKLMYVTYPFVNQLLRLYIDYIVGNSISWKEIFTEQSQEYFLKIILLIMKKSKKTEQFLKCENCKIKSGLHDALRLSFLSIHFVKQNSDVENLLPLFNEVIEHQHATLKELAILGCGNYEKCYRKLQTDVHNTAIVLNKSEHYDYSIKLFNIYLEHEIQSFKDNSDLKNISRALYNKSICELDSKKFEDALKNAFLSLIFAWPEGLTSDKYMSLVMDIKAKALKACEDQEAQDKLQLVSVLDACKMCLEEKWYGNLRPFLMPLKFSIILKHEFSMYAKLWPSIVPIAGVWRSLHVLVDNNYNWLSAENEEEILSTLYDVILETSSVVRSMHSRYFRDVLVELMDMFDETPANNTEMQIVQASLLFLKAEFDLHDASEKYQWKITDPSMDPDQSQVTRTISQEYETTRRVVQAVELLTDVLPDIKSVAITKRLKLSLEIAEIFVQQLLQLYRQCHGLQLAYICCVIAEHIDDKLSYVRNAGVILSQTDIQPEVLLRILTVAGKYCSQLLKERSCVNEAIVFVCDAAVHYSLCGATGTAAKLIQFAQTHILNAYDTYEDICLDLAVGRLMQAQCMVCRDSGPSSLTAVNSTQRHYLSISNTAFTRHSRRLLALTLKCHIASTSLSSVTLTKALLLHRRSRSACAVAVPSSGAVALAALYARISNVHNMEDTQIKIDNRLKYILGIETASGSHTHPIAPERKPQVFTPRQELETMLENMTFKKTQISPSLPCISVPGFRTPDFLKHTICDCYACHIPLCYMLTAHTVALEASMYFRAKEMDIARNYFDGAFVCFQLAEQKLMKFSERKCEEFIVNAVGRRLMKEFKVFEVEMLVEASFFELSQNNYEKSDEYVVKIHEIIQDYDVGVYLKNEIMNLMVASAQMRRIVKKHIDTSLESEFENMRLSPARGDPPKTPEVKAKKPPEIPKLIVKDEELPKKRRVIKLNLDEATDDKEPPKKKTEFKIPVPKTSKHVLENITPRNTRSKPSILVTQSDDIKTPKNEFYTPVASTPDEFYTPMSSVKTYSKKSLRHNIVKNLENEFSTPNSDFTKKTLEVPSSARELPSSARELPSLAKVLPKIDDEATKMSKLPRSTKCLPKSEGSVTKLSAELPKAGRSTVKDKMTLKRATSPGKLGRDAPTRSSRRQPVKFKLNDDK